MFVRDMYSVPCFTTDSLPNHGEALQSQNYPSLIPSLLHFYYLVSLSIHQLQDTKTGEFSLKNSGPSLSETWGQYCFPGVPTVKIMNVKTLRNGRKLQQWELFKNQKEKLEFPTGICQLIFS